MTFCRQSSHGGRVLLAAVIALGGLTPVFGQAAAAKAPVPDAAAQAKALKLIAEIFEQQWTGAKTTAQKTALAETMIEQAARTANDPAGQFTLLRVARDIAAQSGDVTTALAAIEMLDRGFHIDAVKMKTDALLTAAKSIVRAEDAKVAADESVALVRAAIAQDDYPVAEQLLRVGQSAARKARDADLVRRLTDLGREMARIVKAYDAIQPALKVLDEKPTDPDANLTVGKFYCLVKGDWQLGVSMLALADNTPYGAPARKELEGVSSPEEQVALGDAWWELAQQGNDSDNTAFLLHATMWYRRAIPRLAPGLLKAKVEQRLTQVDDTPGRDRVAEIPRGALLVMTFERKTFGASQGKTFVRDLSGNDNHGVVEGAVLAKEGKAGSALLFNGRNAHVLLPRMRFLMTRGLTELSISVWVHNREAKNSAVFDVGHWADSDVRIDSLSSRGYRFGLPDMHGGVDLDAAVDGIGTWRHVVGVWDGKEQRIYVDGELKGQVAVPGAALNERTISDIPARIGGQAKSPDRAPRYFNGMIDELAVFNRAITPEEIRALYERGKSGQTLK